MSCHNREIRPQLEIFFFFFPSCGPSWKFAKKASSLTYTLADLIFVQTLINSVARV